MLLPRSMRICIDEESGFEPPIDTLPPAFSVVHAPNELAIFAIWLTCAVVGTAVVVVVVVVVVLVVVVVVVVVVVTF